MTAKRSRGSLPGDLVVLKENPARSLIEDAERAVDAARQARDRGDEEAEASFSRAAILLYFAALEGFINFVYAWSEVEGREHERWSTEKKWRRAAELCLPGHGTIYDENGQALHRPGDRIDAFDADIDLLARFNELRQTRNDMVHIQPVFTRLIQEGVDEHLSRTEHYSKTGLPKRLTHFRSQHAATVASLFDAMVDRLDVCLKGGIHSLIGAPAMYERRLADENDDPLDEE